MAAFGNHSFFEKVIGSAISGKNKQNRYDKNYRSCTLSKNTPISNLNADGSDYNVETRTFCFYQSYHSSPSRSLAGTSMTLGFSMILAVLSPFSTSMLDVLPVARSPENVVSIHHSITYIFKFYIKYFIGNPLKK